MEFSADEIVNKVMRQRAFILYFWRDVVDFGVDSHSLFSALNDFVSVYLSIGEFAFTFAVSVNALEFVQDSVSDAEKSNRFRADILQASDNFLTVFTGSNLSPA